MKKAIRHWVMGWAIAAQSLGLAVAGTPPATGAALGGGMPPTVAFDRCSWDHPGVNPFMGDVVAAVDRYRDIPPEVRDRLKARMAKRDYDDLVSIRRDAITGRGGYRYGEAIADMHFGTNQVCRTVTRASWTPQMEERGLVYCESGTCILVPTVCRNVSRVSRAGVGNDVAEGLAPFMAPGAGYPVVANEAVAEAPVPVDPAVTASSLGTVRDGGPIGNAAYVGGIGPYAAGGAVGGLATLLGAGGGGGSGGSVAASSGKSADAAASAATATDVTAVTAVPEPETWMLMVGGVVALGLAQRRALQRRRCNSGAR